MSHTMVRSNIREALDNKRLCRIYNMEKSQRRAIRIDSHNREAMSHTMVRNNNRVALKPRQHMPQRLLCSGLRMRQGRFHILYS